MLKRANNGGVMEERDAFIQKWILHMDMDAFFASVEQLDNPALKGLPVIVGTGSRSVVSAASYEARRFGVRSAMPIFKARQLCPQGVFVPVRFHRYVEVSRQIFTVLKEFSPLVEQCSIDEAYLDATELVHRVGPPEEIAARLKHAVKGVSSLTCSVGMAPLKFLAKICSDLNKPDGVTILYPDEMPAFLAALPLEKIPGVGRQTMKILNSMGMSTAGDMLKNPPEFWSRRLGKMGTVLYQRASGHDPRQIVPYRAPKSESAERTLEKNTSDPNEMKNLLLKEAERVGNSLKKMGFSGRTVTLKIKYADFTQITRSKTLPRRVNDPRIIYETAATLLDALEITQPVRLVGLGVSNFEGKEKHIQLMLDY